MHSESLFQQPFHPPTRKKEQERDDFLNSSMDETAGKPSIGGLSPTREPKDIGEGYRGESTKPNAIRVDRRVALVGCEDMKIGHEKKEEKSLFFSSIFSIGDALIRIDTRREIRSCRRPPWYFVVMYLLVASLCMAEVVEAVFTPVGGASLKAAIGTCNNDGCIGGCLGETPDGSCPIFAASNDTTGNPYGVIDDWNVAQVAQFDESKSISVRTFCSWMVSDLFIFFDNLYSCVLYVRVAGSVCLCPRVQR